MLVRNVAFSERGESATARSLREAQELQEHLGGEEGVTARGVAVVGYDAETLAECIKGEALDFGAAGEGTVALEVERQVHGVDPAVAQCEAEVTPARTRGQTTIYSSRCE